MTISNGVDEWLERNWASSPTTFSTVVEGAELACRGWNLDATHLPGLVLVHGFRAHAHWWDHIAPSLATHQRVVAFSFSGMGDSDRRKGYSRVLAGREILGVAAAAGFARPTIIAHSFGAIAALLAARSEPERIKRVIVVDCGIPDQSDHQIPITQRRYYPDAETAASRFRLIPPGRWPQPKVLDYIARNSVVQTPHGWTWKFDPEAALSFNRERYRAAMFGIEVPVDVIRGEHSEIMTPPRIAMLRQMARNVSREILIPASHHHILIEQPSALASALEALLARDG